jgi:hypothetical protein
MTMNWVWNLLLWPVGVFLQAVCGVLHEAKTPTVALFRTIARMALLAGVMAFATAPLFMIARPAIGIKPPLVLGAALLVVFVVFGKLCDDQAGDKDIERDVSNP